MLLLNLIHQLGVLLAFAGIALSEPCHERVEDTVLQLTSQQCTCCTPLDAFLADGKPAYILFYASKGRLNVEMSATFEALAKEWKWSKVHFGRIDVDRDRGMVTKWMDPNMVPTNIMFRSGQPIVISDADVSALKEKYRGSVEGQSWLITKYLGGRKATSNLHYVREFYWSESQLKALKKVTISKEIAFVCFAMSSSYPGAQAYKEAVWRVHRRSAAGMVNAAFAFAYGEKFGKEQRLPSVVAFVDGMEVESDGVWPVKEERATAWRADAIADFMQSFLPVAVGKEPHTEL